MMNYIIDASVAVKWYIPEILSTNAVLALEKTKNKQCELFAPDLILSEIGNVLWKKKMKNELTQDEIRSIVQAVVKAFPVTIVSSRAFLAAALEIALVYRRTVYDSLYLTLAIEKKACLITADKRMVNSMADTPFRENVVYLGDVL